MLWDDKWDYMTLCKEMRTYQHLYKDPALSRYGLGKWVQFYGDATGAVVLKELQQLDDQVIMEIGEPRK
jgi:hypothetical protein